MVVSNRIKDIRFGGLYDIFSQASELERTGKRLIHMEIGRPDFTSPKCSIECVKDSLDAGQVHYTAVQGIYELREAVSDREKRRQNLCYMPENEIVITAGACEALTATFLGLLDPGDEIIIPGPFFSAYEEIALFAQVKIKELPLSVENEWSIDMDRLNGMITDKTKGILINSPNNPAGYVFSHEELKKIADIAIENNIFVISDETYDEFFYGEKVESIAGLEGMRDRTIVVKSASKLFSMTGWRIGYLMGNEKTLKYLNKIHQNLSTCATSFAQYGAVQAYRQEDSFVEKMVGVFKERRDYFFKELNSIDGFELVKPEGAFYMFPKVSNLGLTSREFCDILMNKAGVVAVPGDFFGESGRGYIRLAYCRSMEELETAAMNIKKIVENL